MLSSFRRGPVHWRGVLVGSVVAALVGSGLALAGTARTTGLQVLTGDVLPGLSSMPSSPLPGTLPIQVGITMVNPHAGEQHAAFRAIYDPASPQYHHFLSASDVARRFGVDNRSFVATRAWATRDGLQLLSTTGTHEYLLLGGTAAQVQKTFAVTLRQYGSGASAFYANTAGPRVPVGVGVAGVLGLNSRNRMHTFGTRPSRSAPHGRTPAQDSCTRAVCMGLTTPQDLWSIYHQPSNNFGEGQQLAVFGEGAVQGVVENLRAFESSNKLPRIPITVRSVGDDFKDNSGEVEWDLDTQSSTGMAPKALGETLYFGKNLGDAPILGTFNVWSADQNGPLQANASFGECEQDPAGASPTNGIGTPIGGLAGSSSKMFTDGSENALEQANLQGKTLFASTGDTGSSCPVVVAAVIGAGNGVLNQGFPETNYPASSPHVVAVGGTVLYGTPNTAKAGAASQPSNATRSSEYAWTFTGGGNSFYIARPDYQKDIALLSQPCLTKPDGTPYTSPTPCRGIPDVAAQSGDVVGNGYAITAMGQSNYPGGGTSLSSPLWMGMWARVQAAATTKNGAGSYTNGFANPALYRIGTDPAKASAFFDVGAGGPTAPITTNGIYASAPGWDYVTGLGVPNVSELTTYLTGKTAPTNAVTAPAPSDCAQPGITCGPGSPLSGVTGALNPCLPLLTDSRADDAYIGDPSGSGGNPQLDIVQGDMRTVTQGGVRKLETVLKIADLSTSPAAAGGAANEYYVLWTHTPAGGKPTTYFSNVEVDSVTGAISYADGTVGGTQYTTVHSNDTGSFNPGKGGTVVVDVPLTNVGSLNPGDQLTGTGAQTKVLVGSGATGGLIEAADSAGPGQSYVLGQFCRAAATVPPRGVKGGPGGGPTKGGPTSMPATGLPFWLPFMALGLLAGAAAIRRRRSGASQAA